MTTKEQRIEFVIADITEQDVDAIVNAANGNLRHGGGVAKAIRIAAGDEPFQEYCYEVIAEHGVVPTGQAIVTESGDLPCRKVIHAVGPVYGEHDGAEPELLAEAYQRTIALAEENGLRTLAFPAISCGIFGYPLEEAAATSIAAVREALAEHPEVGLVRFCFIGQEEKIAFEKAYLTLCGVDSRDYEEACRIIRHGTTEDLAAFLSRDVDGRAMAAAEQARTSGGSFTEEGLAPDTEMPAERTEPTSRHTLDGEDWSA